MSLSDAKTTQQSVDEELERVRRVSDMLVTMHCELRDSLGRRALALDCLLLLSSILLVALVFVDPAVFNWMPWSSMASRVTIGVLGIMDTFLALLLSRVDWKGRSEAHRLAAEAYSQVKLECIRLQRVTEDRTPYNVERLLNSYSELGRTHVAVPEGKFLALKGKHYTKVLISRYLDRYPGASVPWLRLLIWLRHTRVAGRAIVHEDATKPSGPNPA